MCSVVILHMLRLDYLSCVLTIGSTILVGRKQVTGWWIAALNSVLICLIGMESKQYGFIPANLFCLGLYAVNIKAWKGNSSRKSSGERIFAFPRELLKKAERITDDLLFGHSVGIPR